MGASYLISNVLWLGPNFLPASILINAWSKKNIDVKTRLFNKTIYRAKFYEFIKISKTAGFEFYSLLRQFFRLILKKKTALASHKT